MRKLDRIEGDPPAVGRGEKRAQVSFESLDRFLRQARGDFSG